MARLWATILKDIRILLRDRVGLIMMFAMPIILVLVITSVQNSTFELVNDNKIAFLVCNKDKGDAGKLLDSLFEKSGMFRLSRLERTAPIGEIAHIMQARDAMVAVVIPENFSSQIAGRARNITVNALKGLGIQEDTTSPELVGTDSLIMLYHPVLQPSFRLSVEGAIRSAVQLVQNKQIVRSLYFTLHEKNIPDSLEEEIVKNQIPISESPASRGGSRNIPNASQHNVPAWTIFAMFFVVISLGSSLVREKSSGSFLRLKTLPTSYLVALLSKLITYVFVTTLQAAVIFSIGIWLFPVLGLPRLELPADIAGLFIVTLVCGICAASFAICVGVFAQTQEQANGFGAAAIVILAALGGVLVPSFAMPASFKTAMQVSPLHWCLEAYYGLFLEGGKLADILTNILSLLIITALLLIIALAGLKRKNLI
jgi:ABC-2 type transport system permease protein